MTNTHFVNANGLPDSRQLTTARDIAILSRAVMRDYPQYYHYFGHEQFTYRGVDHAQPQPPAGQHARRRRAQDRLHQRLGFNLAASAVRDGRRLIAVVMGGPSGRARATRMSRTCC